MEFLENALNLKVTYNVWNHGKDLPFYLSDRYTYSAVNLSGIDVIFLYPKFELEPISSIKKHIEKIKSYDHIPVVLILEKMTARERKYLIDANISFVVKGKQIYLPFLGVLLQERYSMEMVKNEKLLPSTQMLLLYFLLYKENELFCSDAINALGFTPMSISRATKQLEDLDLINTKKEGVKKIIYTTQSKKVVYEKALLYLGNPVKKSYYISKKDLSENWCFAGYTALSKYTMINPTKVVCYATSKVGNLDKLGTKSLLDADTQVQVQIWKYDPIPLSSNGIVDTLSLVLSLSNNNDERTLQAIDTILDKQWR